MQPIEVFDELESTNTELMARGRLDAPHGVAIRARVQTAGRGQRAHGWASPEGGLYLSALVRPHVPAHVLPGLPVACALGVLCALHGTGAAPARLKWPNDVVVEDRKLAGILTELGVSPSGTFAVCGVGVNMHAPQVDERRSAGAAALPPIGLADVLDPAHEVPDLDGLAECVRAGILEAVLAWERRVRCVGADEPPLSDLVDAYNDVLAFRGELVNAFAIDGDLVDTGIFGGVDAWGRALLEHTDGTHALHDATAVSLRPIEKAAPHID